MQIGVTRSEIEECLRNIKVVDGMDSLFEFVTANGGEIVVISASFAANVECGLEGAGLLRHVSAIYTNPSAFSPATGELVVCQTNSNDAKPCSISGR